MHHRVPLPGGLGRINRGVADPLQVLGNLAAAGYEQVPVAQVLESWTQIETHAAGEGHGHVGVYMDKSSFFTDGLAFSAYLIMSMVLFCRLWRQTAFLCLILNFVRRMILSRIHT
jgi:hypothetical protein